MIVDVGAGITHIAVISFGGTVNSCSFRTAGTHMDEAIMDCFQSKYHVLVDETIAERIKIEIGSAYPLPEPRTMAFPCKDLHTGAIRNITLCDTEIRNALKGPVSRLLRAIRFVVERTPPELLADLSDCGIVLSGGGALMKGLDELVCQETGLPVVVADHPLLNVVLGAGQLFSHPRSLDKVALMQDAAHAQIAA